MRAFFLSTRQRQLVSTLSRLARRPLSEPTGVIGYVDKDLVDVEMCGDWIAWIAEMQATKVRSRWLVVVAVSVALAAAGFLLGRPAEDPSRDASNKHEVSIGAESLRTDGGEPRGPVDPSVAPASVDASAANGWDRGYGWNPGNPGIAVSEEDARWLDSHGYPGPEVEMRLRGLPLAELHDLANAGNQAAKAIYAWRIAEKGAPRAHVLELLSEAARAGSVYALKTAGDLHVHVDGYQDLVLANAYYMLQARAGDQGGFELGLLTDYHLDPTQRFRARAMEQALWNGLQLSSLADSPVRPGYEEFLDTAVTAGIKE